MPPNGATGFSGGGSDQRATFASFGVGRVLGNVFIRFPYVLITPLSAGLGISLSATTTVLGVRELGGLATPIAGHLADRGHERRTVVGAGLVTAACCVMVAVGGGVGLFAAVMIVGGAAKMFLDTGQATWIAHRVPFARRGRVIGTLEVTWAAAFLFGVPACAWLTDQWGWRAPFLALGVAMAAAAIVTGLVMGPPDRNEAPVTAPFSDLIRWRPPPGWWGLYAFAFLQPFAQMTVFAVAGDWFVTDLGMSLTGLGLNTMLIGCGELAGTAASAWSADHIGKRRAAMWGMAGAAPIALVLVVVGANAALGVAVLIAFAASLELAFVSWLAISTEFAPGSRGAALGTVLAVVTLSRAIASVAAGPLYVASGIAGAAVCAALASGLGCWALWRGASEPAT